MATKTLACVINFQSESVDDKYDGKFNITYFNSDVTPIPVIVGGAGDDEEKLLDELELELKYIIDKISSLTSSR